ncbi:MAG: 16S rRNA (adenine(1518)-N(6)/adenine(1519)-N(6))-dimethyltransferase RsmA [Brevinemataceae bacterium]
MNYDPFGIQNIKHILSNNNLYLSKSRGQNYLINQQTAKKITDVLPDLKENQMYFEVGTGLGALTVLLVERGTTISLEIDKGIYQTVQQNFNHENLIHKHEDFLSWNEENVNTEYIFISNLPYSISGEAVKKFIECRQFQMGIVMLQKEFVDRMLASAGTSNYGPLSVISQTFLSIENQFSVGKGNFFPEPSIDSIVIKLYKKNININQKEFSFFIKQCFHAKRKTLSNNLAQSPWAESSITKDSICKLRPDAITPEKWMELFIQKDL